MRNKLNLTLVILLLSLGVFAQNEDDLHGDTLIVVKAYQPILVKADKMNENPTIQDTQKVELDFNYPFLSKQIPVNFQTDTIQAAKIKGEPLVKLYRGYIRLGVGSNTTPLFEAFYNSLRSKKTSWGVHARHFSSNGINRIDNSNFSHNGLDIYGKKMTKKHTFSGGVDYQYDKLNYYGSGDGVLLDRLNLIDQVNKEQAYGKLYLHGEVENLKNDSTGFNYVAGVQYRNTQDDYKAKEGNFILHSLLKRKLDNGLVGFLTLDIDNNTYESEPDSSLKKISNTIVKAQPQVKAGNEKWHALAGVALYLESETTSRFKYNLMAELKVNLIEEILIPYAGVKGGMQRNNFTGFTAENPFLESSVQLLNSFQEYHFYGGLRGSFSSRISFNTSLSQSKTENMPFYVKGDVNNVLFNRGFGVVYDDVNLTQLTGEVSYQNKEKIKLFLIGDYFDYNMTNLNAAWHKPTYKVTVSALYDLQNKIIAKLDVYFIGKQKANDIQYSQTTVNGPLLRTETIKTLDGIVDVNLGLEYRYTKKVAAFVNFNNIASVKYERWQDYPTQQFNVLGGLKFSF
jgi:hypothetical protein